MHGNVAVGRARSVQCDVPGPEAGEEGLQILLRHEIVGRLPGQQTGVAAVGVPSDECVTRIRCGCQAAALKLFYEI